MNLPDAFLAFGAGSWLGVPLVAWTAAVVAIAAQLVLSSTPFGRQLYAIGANPEAARTIGVDVRRAVAAVYVISGACAGLGGLLALAQLGAVSPRFGELYEFDAITAAVLGGTSLYGGQGRVLPGVVLGALLLKSIFNALVLVQANPYLYPLITASVIFGAVLVDTLRRRLG
jgi:ribose transport system permease protein